MSDMLEIAGLGISWKKHTPPFFKGFDVCESTNNVIEFHNEPPTTAYGITYTATSSAHCLTCDGGGILVANDDWSKVISYSEGTKDTAHSLALAAISTRFAAFGAVLLHGALVDLDGNGIVFAGPSGIGKTTQAELWNKYLNADIINGDKVFLRCFEEGVFACGSPWCGSSSYRINRNVSLKGIAVLRQAETNSLSRLDALQCAELFIPHVFLPSWDKVATAQALDTLDTIVDRIPVFLLQCRADKNAVMLLNNALI